MVTRFGGLLFSVQVFTPLLAGGALAHDDYGDLLTSTAAHGALCVHWHVSFATQTRHG